MVGLAISILWLLIGVIILGAVIYFAFKVLRLWFEVDPRIEQAVWIIFFILILIYVLVAIQGGGLPSPHVFR